MVKLYSFFNFTCYILIINNKIIYILFLIYLIIKNIYTDVFLPCPENLIVNLKEREELVRDLLTQLPIKFQGTHDTNSALGAALQAAYKLMVRKKYNYFMTLWQSEI